MKSKNLKLNKKDAELIDQKYALNYLVLFGSQAEKTARSSSDFDIAFSSKKELSPSDEVTLREAIARALSILTDKIDLVNTRNAGPLLMKQISDQGQLIHEFTPNSYDNFQIYAFMNYIEAKPLFKMKEEYVKRKLK